MAKFSILFTHLVVLGCFSGLSAQTSFQVGFWNIENLFDTTDAQLVQDEDFTPTGRYQWTEARLSKKFESLSRVIHDLDSQNDLAILGLAEIENYAVLSRLNDDFIKRGMAIVHKESPDERGIDCALLYDSSLVTLVKQRFIPIFLAGGEKTRDIIETEFRLKDASGKQSLYVFVNHWPSRWGGQEQTDPLRRAAANTLRTRVDQILMYDPQADIVIMGDFNDYPTDPSLNEVLRAHALNPTAYPGDLINTTWKLHAGHESGTYKYRGEWGVLDQIIISQGMINKKYFEWGFESTHPFAEPYLIESEGKYSGWPFRMFRSGTYQGGYSDHLPIICNIIFTNN